MTALLLSVALLPSPDPMPWEICNGVPDCHMVGKFSYYGKGPTDAMIAYGIEHYGIPADWPGPFIAVVDCGRIGDSAWIDIGAGWREAKIFDCAGKDADLDLWASANWLFELDYYSSVQAGTYGKGLQPGRLAWREQG